MNVGEAAALGLLQGLTEFLPVSSSGHLELAARFWGWDITGLLFALAVHLGTLAALLFYFRRDLFALLIGRRAADRSLRRSLMVATVVTVTVGLLFAPYRGFFLAPVVTAAMLVGFGLLLWLVDRLAAVRPAFIPKNVASVVLGAAQAVALVPGVSRSGVVITAGRALGLDRAAATRYAFLLSVPVVALAPLYLLVDGLPNEPLTAPIVVGAAAAATSGYLAIAWLMKLVVRTSFGWFALYRFALAAAVWLLL